MLLLILFRTLVRRSRSTGDRVATLGYAGAYSCVSSLQAEQQKVGVNTYMRPSPDFQNAIQALPECLLCVYTSSDFYMGIASMRQ